MKKLTFLHESRQSEGELIISLREPPPLPPTGSDGQGVRISLRPIPGGKHKKTKGGA